VLYEKLLVECSSGEDLRFRFVTADLVGKPSSRAAGEAMRIAGIINVASPREACTVRTPG
jgi:hypothetical protein